MPSHPAIDLCGGRVDLVAWHDPIIDKLGHDPRSNYAESFWLGIVGPSALWFLRHTARLFEQTTGDEVIPLDVADTAGSIGMSWSGGRNAPFSRTVDRTIRYGMARAVDRHTLAVRRSLPPITNYQVEQLPQRLRHAHNAWRETQHEPQKPSISSSRVLTPKPVAPLAHSGVASSLDAGPAMSR